MIKSITLMAGVIIAVGLCGIAIAGSIDAPGAPSSGSGMYTFSQVYDYLNSGIEATPAPSFQEPGAAPGSTMKSMKDIYDDLKLKYIQCDVTVDSVESGKRFFSTQPGSWGVQTGTLVTLPRPTVTPTATATATPIWLQGWGYRRPVAVSNSGSALTNYQVLVTVNTQELISAKMRSDGGDIRFTDSDKLTLIDYWVESGINSPSTKIWVKIASVPSGSKTIYIYYGKSSAESLSDSSKFLNYGLVSYWNFESNADVVNGTMNMTPHDGQITFDTTNSFKGKSGYFDASHNMDLANSNSLHYWEFTSPTTVSGWFRREYTSINQTTIFGKRAGGVGWYEMDMPPVELGIVTTTPLGYGQSLTLNTWEHKVITRDSTNTCYWRNGVSVQCQPNTASPPVGNTNATFGGNQAGYNDFAGRMDEIGYWNRCLANQEISQLYNSGSGLALFAAPAPTVDVGTEEEH